MRLRRTLIAAAGIGLLAPFAGAGTAVADEADWKVTATGPTTALAAGGTFGVHAVVVDTSTGAPVPGATVSVFAEWESDSPLTGTTDEAGAADIAFPLKSNALLEVDVLDADGDFVTSTEIRPVFIPPKPTLTLTPATTAPYQAQYAKLKGVSTYQLNGVLQRRRVGGTTWSTVDGTAYYYKQALLWAPATGDYEFRLSTIAQPDYGLAATVSNTVRIHVAGTAPAWLTTLNALRAKAGAGPVAWDAQANKDAALHARYMAVNHVMCHCETAGKPYYSAKGNDVAQGSLIALQTGVPAKTDLAKLSVEGLSTAPFHSIDLLSKREAVVGMGTYRSGGYTAEDVYLYGNHAAEAILYRNNRVQMFPGNGQVLPAYETNGPNETPSPYTACTGYAAGKSGTPLWVTVGDPGFEGLDKRLVGYKPKLRSVTLTENGKKVPVCSFTSDTYRNTNAGTKAQVRDELDFYNAAVVVPAKPLKRGAKYSATVVTQKETIRWSFSVAK
ncbi:CAP domain-containing protein [Streptomyces sp. NPDC127038]|uniref:CAP domain-containing protein n=1 Tax=Streptomyces sp. NPDC127038 TaxID=3347114 RepID=UPI00365333F0